MVRRKRRTHIARLPAAEPGAVFQVGFCVVETSITPPQVQTPLPCPPLHPRTSVLLLLEGVVEQRGDALASGGGGQQAPVVGAKG